MSFFQCLLAISILISTSTQYTLITNGRTHTPRSENSVVIALTDKNPYDAEEKITLRRVNVGPATRTLSLITPLLGSSDTSMDGTMQDSSLSTIDQLILSHFLGTPSDTEKPTSHLPLHSPLEQHHHPHHSHNLHHPHFTDDKTRQLFLYLAREQPLLIPLLAPILHAASGSTGAAPISAAAATATLSSPISPISSLSPFTANMQSGILSDETTNSMPLNIDPIVAQGFLNGIMMGLQGSGSTGSFAGASILSDPVRNIPADDNPRLQTNLYTRAPISGNRRKQVAPSEADDDDAVIIGDSKPLINEVSEQTESKTTLRRSKPGNEENYSLKPWTKQYRFKQFENLDELLLSPDEVPTKSQRSTIKDVHGSEYAGASSKFKPKFYLYRKPSSRSNRRKHSNANSK